MCLQPLARKVTDAALFLPIDMITMARQPSNSMDTQHRIAMRAGFARPEFTSVARSNVRAPRVPRPSKHDYTIVEALLRQLKLPSSSIACVPSRVRFAGLRPPLTAPLARRVIEHQDQPPRSSLDSGG